MACKYFLDAYGDKNLFELTEEDVTNAILVSYGAGVRMGQRFFSFLKFSFPIVCCTLNMDLRGH